MAGLLQFMVAFQ